MRLSDFDYELPAGLIAREPVRPRDASRMMVVNSRTGEITDTWFRQLPDLLKPSDVLVLNNTRVMRARLFGRLQRSGNPEREIEILLSAPAGGGAWEVMCKPGKCVRSGDRVRLEPAGVVGVFGERTGHGLRLLRLETPEPVETVMEECGHMPLPPYLRRAATDKDSEEYQTVFAEVPGAVAAPTAGLHFTVETFESLRRRGIQVETITLHVGIATFIPVRTDDPERHSLKPERYEIAEGTAARLNAARASGRRLVAVGTTTTRTLEYVLAKHGQFLPGKSETDLFILPGYRFQAVDGLLTNFHLPGSTLLMLVSAFASRSILAEAYRRAIDRGYRFYSYGDCMLLI
jgi:S-adenosylmethionine:tRNA ribosyltransferase-isomerase